MNKQEVVKILLVGIGAFLIHRIAQPTIQIPQQEAARETAVAERIAQKVAQKKIGEPTNRAAYIAALQKAAAQKAAAQRAALQRAAAREAAAQKRIAQPTNRAAYIAALRKAAAQRAWIERHRKIKAQKAAVRKATAQKIGKKIGKKVGKKVIQTIETGGRTGMALVIFLKKALTTAQALSAQAANAVKTHSKILLPSSRWAGGRTGVALATYLKKAAEKLEQALAQAKEAQRRPDAPKSKLFPGSERSRIIPYSESSKGSYYGSKTTKVLNEGYMEKRYKADMKQAQDDRIRELSDLRDRYEYNLKYNYQKR